MSPLTFFHHIVRSLEQQYSHLTRSYMLSSPAIEYKGRVFAFCQKDHIVIKIGDTTRLAHIGVRGSCDYQPFTNPLGLNKWQQVPYYYHADWQQLAEMALDNMIAEVDVNTT